MNRWIGIFASLAIALSTTGASCSQALKEAGNDPDIKRNIKKVEIGMTEDQVLDIMGKPENKQSHQSSYGGKDITLYYDDWQLAFEEGVLDRINRW